MKMTKDEFLAKSKEYLSTLGTTRRDELYGTNYDVNEAVLSGFYEWLYRTELAKDARRARYESLKAEFEVLHEEFKGE
jgi:hypothetical protein